ncbi:MAG TPA: heparinase II/III family protein, partial [Alphaproteobacteria bacterium]|nr:heparinase II/III family protein [Alphaproteobacteria bacterium]
QFIEELTGSLHRQWKHLLRTMPPNLSGVTGLRAIKGLVYGGFNFPEGDRALGLALDLLRRQMAVEILPDGGSISRNPSTQLHLLRHIIDLRAAFQAAGLDIPDTMRAAISAMVPAIKFYRHGDGGLPLFHGGIEETPLLIDAVLTQADVRARALRRLPETGYERITAGRSLLLVDCSTPPPRGYGAGHAGLLSFEFATGKERIIVNCGAVPGGAAEWRAACASTAAHSTLSVEDCNACEVMASGNVICTARVDAQRYEQEGTQFVDMAHDGYVPKYGITHQRVLSLSGDGEELRGREILTGPAGRNYALRWHLHPGVQASLAQSGQTALLRTSGGTGWRLRVENGELGLEQSIYCGNGAPRRSQQLRVSGITSPEQTTIFWSLSREKKSA